jgi:hypothetical protein
MRCELVRRVDEPLSSRLRIKKAPASLQGLLVGDESQYGEIMPIILSKIKQQLRLF